MAKSPNLSRRRVIIRLLVVGGGGVALLLLAINWFVVDDEPEQPLLQTDSGDGVRCDPLGEYARAPNAMAVKYGGKTVRLSGLVESYRYLEGSRWLVCRGYKGQVFHVSLAGPDQTREVDLGYSITVDARLRKGPSFFATSVWDGDLVEVRKNTGEGWKTVWPRRQP